MLDRVRTLRRRWLALPLGRRWAVSAVGLVIALALVAVYAGRRHPDEDEARDALRSAGERPTRTAVQRVDPAQARLVPLLAASPDGATVRRPTAAEARAIDPRGDLADEHGASTALARGVATRHAGRVWILPARDELCVALRDGRRYRTSCAGLDAVRRGLLQIAREDGPETDAGVQLVIAGVAPRGTTSVPILGRRLPARDNVFSGVVTHPSMSPDPSAAPSAS